MHATALGVTVGLAALGVVAPCAKGYPSIAASYPFTPGSAATRAVRVIAHPHPGIYVALATIAAALGGAHSVAARGPRSRLPASRSPGARRVPAGGVLCQVPGLMEASNSP